MGVWPVVGIERLRGQAAYQAVADDLRERIGRGEFVAGGRLPTTAELVRAYGVSTTVVRAAVSRLEQAGVLVGWQGKGVFVGKPPMMGPLSGAAPPLWSEVAELRRRVERLEQQAWG